MLLAIHRDFDLREMSWAHGMFYYTTQMSVMDSHR